MSSLCRGLIECEKLRVEASRLVAFLRLRGDGAREKACRVVSMCNKPSE